ncbi:MAG: WD40/YVTN/BNR-like repeat-containing protein, partial [Chryseotalea sp.]
SYWQEVSFGDGFDVSPDPVDPRYGYTMSQGGNLLRYDQTTGNNQYIRPTHPDASVKLRYNWNSALAQDPHDVSSLYYGSQFLHKSTDKGNTWQVISPDLTTNDKEKQKQDESGGLTMDATGAENHCTILAIAPSPLDKNVIWVGTDDGNVQVTRDGGKTWTNTSPKIVGLPKNAWVPQIKASTYKAGEAYVVVNNYRQFDYKPYLFRTRDFGATWETVVTPAQVGESNYTLAVVQDPVEPKLLFLGTENGMWVSIDEGKNWTKWTNAYPAGVPTIDLVIHPREHDLVIGTFGRALYVLDDIRPLRDLAGKGSNVLNKTLHVFPAPVAYQAINQQPTGPRFDADAVFNGENRPYGAMISYVVNKPAEKKEEKKAEPAKTDAKGKKAEPVKEEKKPETPKVKYDSLTVEIFNAKNEKIRTMKQKSPDENGVQRMQWMMNQKGVRGPSREKPRSNAGEPGGLQVLPGTYKLRVTFGDQKDSTNVEVQADPRLNVSPAIIESRYAMMKDLEKMTSNLAEATTRLRESLDLVSDLETKMKESKRTDLKEAQDKSKAVKDSINALFDKILDKEDKRQGLTRDSEGPVVDIQTAESYIDGNINPINETDRRVFGKAQQSVQKAIDSVNQFYEKTWKEYRAMMEKVTLNPFKDYQPIK